VTVTQEYGYGNYAYGASTIFIGDDPYFNQATAQGQTLNTKGAVTPAISEDGPLQGPTHQPHSFAANHPYDVAFVDPTFQVNPAAPLQNDTDTNIAQSIAHEPGHMFGLVHVLSNPTSDIMSYDASNIYFANQTFSVTNLNYNGQTGQTTNDPSQQPTWTDPADGTTNNVTTQNSYTFLQAVVGARPGHHPFVIDKTAVDSTAYANFTQTYSPEDFGWTGGLGEGEFRAYTFQAADAGGVVKLDLASPDQSFTPVALVYPSDGEAPTYIEGSIVAPGDFEIHTYLPAAASSGFQLVIGEAGGHIYGNGSFQLNVHVYYPGTNAVNVQVGDLANTLPSLDIPVTLRRRFARRSPATSSAGRSWMANARASAWA
jgi:hypothetical protein